MSRKSDGSSKINVLDKLTENQLKFCLAYSSNGMKVGSACESIGLNRRTGTEYLKNPNVQEYLKILADSSNQIATTTELLEILTKFARGTEKDEMINVKTGNIEKVLPNTMSRTKAIELLLKQRGEMVQKIEADVKTEFIIEYGDDGMFEEI